VNKTTKQQNSIKNYEKPNGVILKLCNILIILISKFTKNFKIEVNKKQKHKKTKKKNEILKFLDSRI